VGGGDGCTATYRGNGISNHTSSTSTTTTTIVCGRAIGFVGERSHIGCE